MADEARCTFCGKHQDDVWVLISNSLNTYICEECVALCSRVVSEKKAGRLASDISFSPAEREAALETLNPK